MKNLILNLFAGIGGNTTKWNREENLVIHIENNSELCSILSKRFPTDEVFCTDAMEQVLKTNFKNYSLVFASPPCQTHSRARSKKNQAQFADMKLYQLILFFQEHAKCPWIIENVIPKYTPLIPGVIRHRHMFWSNFALPQELTTRSTVMHESTISELAEFHNIELSLLKGISNRKDQILRNCVDYEIGKTILQVAQKNYKSKGNQIPMFNE